MLFCNTMSEKVNNIGSAGLRDVHHKVKSCMRQQTSGFLDQVYRHILSLGGFISVLMFRGGIFPDVLKHVPISLQYYSVPLPS